MTRLTDEQIIAILDTNFRKRGQTMDFARAIEAAVLAANPQVPREPTPEMANAGSEYSGLPSMTWRAMYDAAIARAGEK